MDMDHGNEGAMARGEIDQLTARFREVTERLAALHRAALARTKEGDRVPQEIQQKIYETMRQAFVDQDNPVEIFNYIMYLIDAINGVRTLQLEMGIVFNTISDSLNKGAELIGMKPIYNPQVVENLDERNHIYTTGSGQQIHNIHAREDCQGWCVMHNPVPGPWQDWTVVWRGDGPLDIWRGFERICPCGVPHTAVEHILEGDMREHECCGICPCGPSNGAKPVFNEVGLLVSYE